MPSLFLSEEELERYSGDGRVVAEKADAFIKQVYEQLETVKAKADAASITAEQTCSLLEQKYVSLSSEYANLQSHHSQLNSSLDQRLSEIAQLQADKHQIHLQSVSNNYLLSSLSFFFCYSLIYIYILSPPYMYFSPPTRLVKMERLSGWRWKLQSCINPRGSWLNCYNTRIWRSVRKTPPSRLISTRLYVLSPTWFTWHLNHPQFLYNINLLSN